MRVKIITVYIGRCGKLYLCFFLISFQVATHEEEHIIAMSPKMNVNHIFLLYDRKSVCPYVCFFVRKLLLDNQELNN